MSKKGMARGNAEEQKCFTFVWKIENASYLCGGTDSPVFVVDEIERSEWQLIMLPFKNNKIHFSLMRFNPLSAVEWVRIEWQIALLASDGTVLLSCSRRKGKFSKEFAAEVDIVPADAKDVFLKRISEFLPQDTLTVSCKIWKSGGEMSEAIQWMTCTRIGVERRSYLWKVGKFGSPEIEGKHTSEIKLFKHNQTLLSLDLFFTEDSDEINFAITSRVPLFFCAFELSAVDDSGNAIAYLKDKFRFDKFICKSALFSQSLSKAMLMEKSDFLSIRCVCSFPSEITITSMEIERIISDSNIFENSETKNLCLGRQEESKKVISDSNTFEHSETKAPYVDNGNFLSVRKNVLISDLKSILNERILPDIKLKTKSKTYPAHKCILSARSPVFKAMFSNDMKEKIKECVDIEDLNDDILFSMLQYIYCAEVEELEWGNATQLYEASDKYEILTLRDECSSYLKNNLCQENACEALMLADMHHDENLKAFVQDFILKDGYTIINSEEWEQLMKINLKLAADTMRLKFKGSAFK